PLHKGSRHYRTPVGAEHDAQTTRLRITHPVRNTSPFRRALWRSSAATGAERHGQALGSGELVASHQARVPWTSEMSMTPVQVGRRLPNGGRVNDTTRRCTVVTLLTRSQRGGGSLSRARHRACRHVLHPASRFSADPTSRQYFCDHFARRPLLAVEWTE